MRNEAEPAGRAALWLAPTLAVLLAVLGAGLLHLGSRAHLLLPLALGLSALVLAAERLLRWALRGPVTRYRPLGRLLASLASAALVGIWWEPARVAQALGLGRAPQMPELFPVAGVAMTVAAVWGVAANLGPLLAVATWLVRPVRPLRLTGRLAAAHLGHQSFRAGMAMAMFGLVLCSLTVSTVLLAGAHRAYGRPDAETAGYDLRAQAEVASAGPARPSGAPAANGATASPNGGVNGPAVAPHGHGANGAGGRGRAPALLDLKTALDSAPAARPEDFPAIAAVTSQGGELIRLGGARATWQAANVGVLDDEFLRTTEAHLSVRAPAYGEGRPVWQALAERPGLAVIGAPLAATLGLAPANGTLDPGAALWLRARDGGRAVRLQVIGVLGARSPLGDGVFIAEPTAERAQMPVAQQVTYYLRTREGLTPERAASALNVSFGERGLRASVVDPELRLSQAVQAPLSFLLQGFMGLGLVSGVLAVGLLAARAVLERRSQIGMLRAVGMRAGAVQFSLLLEGSAVALAGAAIGLAVGAGLASQIVRYLQRAHPEFPLVVPIDQLLAMVVLAWGASLLAAAVPAWQAGRIAPVEALRYE
jgi:putative ABC transport system permease protein